MDTLSSFLLAQVEKSNTLIEGSVLDNKFFNPDYLFTKIVSFFRGLSDLSVGSEVADIYRGILYFLTIFFMTLILYCGVRMFEIRKKEHAHLQHEIAEYAHKEREREKRAKHGEEISSNPRWVTTLNYLFSENNGDWKLAVIEADSMLDDLMTQLGFKGETLGEKLKGANQGNFRSLTTAWEVHTVRNRIAHEGIAYELSQHEAKRVIALYELIFREFGFI